MAGNESQVDVEGIRRGRCNNRDCPCPQYCRRVNSVSCNCGHTGLQHAEVVLCRGTVVGGGPCNCQRYRSPPAPYLECLQCGHSLDLHGDFQTGGRSGGEGGRSGGEGRNSSLETARAGIRELAAAHRQEDYNRRTVSEDNRSARGGYGPRAGGRRPGAGRKPLFCKGVEKQIAVTPVKIEKGKPTLTRAAYTHSITIKGEFSVPELKEICRREFSRVTGLDLKHSAVERVFLRMSGLEIYDNASGKELDFKSCCYYNSEFDSIVKFAPKRRSQRSFEEEEEYVDEDDPTAKRQPCGVDEITEDQSIGGQNPLDQTIGGQNPVDQSVGSQNAAEVDDVYEPINTDAILVSDELTSIVETYGVTRDVSRLLMGFCGGEVERAKMWLNEVLCGGPDRENMVKEFHRFFAFGERPGEQGGEPDETVYIRLRNYKDNEGPSMRDQILLQWKSKLDHFHQLADVKFDQGIGNGPRNTYLQAVREYILAPLFEGTEDHRIVTAATDKLMERDYYLGGQFMGHIVRHGQAVTAGLADIIKCAFRGFGVERLYAAMEDLPSFDTQELLGKVLNGGEGAFSAAEKKDLLNLIDDSGLKSGYAWVPSTADTEGYYKIKEGETSYVAAYILQNVVLVKRIAQLNQLIDGFEGVCKFKAFINLCGGEGGNTIVDALTSAYFPYYNACSMTKDEISRMVTTVVNDGEEDYQEALCACIAEVIDQLDEDAKGLQSVSKFLQLCTGCAKLPLGSVVTFTLDDHCDFKVNVCSKMVKVSKKWFECKESKDRFVAHVLREVRESCMVYTSY